MTTLQRIAIALRLRSGALRDDTGASLVEYALLVSFIALACFGALEFMGGSNGASLDDSAGSIITAN